MTPARPAEKLGPRAEAFIGTMTSEVSGVLSAWFGGVADGIVAESIPMTPTDAARQAIRAVLDRTRDAFVAVFRRLWEGGAERGRETVITRHDFDIDADIQEQATIEQLRENGERASEQVEHRIAGDLADALVNAHRAGLSIEETARILRRDVFPDMLSWQSRRIARTEIQSAANKGRLTAFWDADVPGKKWMAIFRNTRAAHKEAHGQVVPVGMTFSVGGERADYPGDPSLSPSNRINCQCVLAAVFDVDEAA